MAIIGTLPVTLQNGTTADATQVMSDFNFIVNQVNANALSTSFVAPGTLLSVQVFSLVGTSTYTPNANASKAWVRAIGGGGAGGGAPATSSGTSGLGLGGCAGAYGEMFIAAGLTSTPITIGAGGAGVSGLAGNAGNPTSFGTLMICQGGAGGGIAGPLGQFVISSSGPASSVMGSGNIILIVPGTIPPTPVISLAGSANQVASGGGASSIWGAGGISQNGQANGGGGLGAGAGGSGGVSTGGGGVQIGGNGAGGRMVIFEFA
jgi:hypothetical protein